MTVFAIDFTVIAVIAFCGWRGYKNGLIRGAFGVVALIVSIFIANVAAKAYSEEFTSILKPFVGGIIDSSLNKTDEDEEDVEDVIDYADELVEMELPDDSEEFQTAYTVLRQIGLPIPSATVIAEKTAEDEIKGYFSDLIADKLSSVLSFMAIFAIAFVLMAIIFTVVGNLIGFVFSLPGLKLVDEIAGVVFGLAKGLIIVYTLATVVRYFGLLARDTVEATSILNYFINNNPIANILGL